MKYIWTPWHYDTIETLRRRPYPCQAVNSLCKSTILIKFVFQRAALVFDTFHVEPDEDICEFDFVQIQDGNNVYVYCGEYLPGEIVAKG